MRTVRRLLHQTGHRPWPVPRRSWLWSQWWLDVLFAHWQVPARLIRPHVPSGLEIETWEESAWVSVVPFRMAHVRPRWLPSVGLISDFLELNFRTYVRREGRPGIYFFSIHAGRPAAVRLARWLSPLPYAHARITCTRANGRYRFGSACTHAPSGEQLFSAEYSPKCEESAAAVGSLDEWLLERYRLYVEDRSGRLLYTEVHHEPWQVRNAELTIFANLVGKSFGVELSRAPDHVHFSRGLPAIAWSFEPIDR